MNVQLAAQLQVLVPQRTAPNGGQAQHGAGALLLFDTMPHVEQHITSTSRHSAFGCELTMMVQVQPYDNLGVALALAY